MRWLAAEKGKEGQSRKGREEGGARHGFLLHAPFFVLFRWPLPYVRVCLSATANSRRRQTPASLSTVQDAKVRRVRVVRTVPASQRIGSPKNCLATTMTDPMTRRPAVTLLNAWNVQLSITIVFFLSNQSASLKPAMMAAMAAGMLSPTAAAVAVRGWGQFQVLGNEFADETEAFSPSIGRWLL